MNRFSKDIGTVDDVLLPDLMQAAIIISLVSGTFINIAIVNPWMIILALILGVLFSFLIKYYLRTAQDVKRLESIGIIKDKMSLSLLISHYPNKQSLMCFLHISNNNHS